LQELWRSFAAAQSTFSGGRVGVPLACRAHSRRAGVARWRRYGGGHRARRQAEAPAVPVVVFGDGESHCVGQSSCPKHACGGRRQHEEGCQGLCQALHRDAELHDRDWRYVNSCRTRRWFVQSCSAVIGRVRNVYGAGGSIESRGWVIKSLAVVGQPKRPLVDAGLLLSPQSVTKQRGDRPVRFKGGRLPVTFRLIRIGHGWRVDEWARAA